MSKISAKVTARNVEAANQRAGRKAVKTQDSFQNFAANLGIGTDNLTSGGTYGFNPVTRNRILLEWIHRGSWVGGMAVDVVADDMTRAGVEFKDEELDPVDLKQLEEAATSLGLWEKINDVIRWSRLYGGAILVPLIKGQDMAQPLRATRVEKDSLKGFLVLDRWAVQPSLEDLVSEFGPDYGLPRFYEVTGDAPGLRGIKIHHTRVLRLEGDRLPYWQRIIENLWGTSVFERIYDRLTAFDSATTGAAQLVYKAWLRVMKIEGLREVVASGGTKLAGLSKYVNNMRKFQSIEGIALIDAKDELTAMEHGAFGGLAEALVQFGQQLGGALQIPLVRLFGMSPAGLNSSGESDLKTYYDGILQKQEKNLKVPVTWIYRCIAASLGLPLTEGFSLEFRPLWQLTEKDKAEVAETITRTVISGVEGLNIPPEIAAEELSRASVQTGVWTGLNKEVLDAMRESANLAPPAELPATDQAIQTLRTQDSLAASAELARKHGLQIVVESPRGSIRRGVDQKTGEAWETRMPADYGYLRGITGADGDQLDAYVGPDARSDLIFVVHQVDRHTKRHDEDKVLVGFPSREAALMCYTMGHSHAAEVFGSIEQITADQLQRRVQKERSGTCAACEAGDCFAHGRAA